MRTTCHLIRIFPQFTQSDESSDGENFTISVEWISFVHEPQNSSHKYAEITQKLVRNERKFVWNFSKRTTHKFLYTIRFRYTNIRMSQVTNTLLDWHENEEGTFHTCGAVQYNVVIVVVVVLVVVDAVVVDVAVTTTTAAAAAAAAVVGRRYRYRFYISCGVSEYKCVRVWVSGEQLPYRKD